MSKSNKQIYNNNNNINTYYFYDELFNKFDNLIVKTKNNLLKDNNFKTVVKERNKLVMIKKDLNSASNILLSIDNIKENIPDNRRQDLLLKLSSKYNLFNSVKKLLEEYHSKLELYFEEVDEYRNYTININNNNNNNCEKTSYLKLYSNENVLNENDLTEQLLLGDIRKNLEISAKNLQDVKLELGNQHIRMTNINDNLIQGNNCVLSSRKVINKISQKKFVIKLILHILVVFMAIVIIVSIIVKLKGKSNYNKDNITKFS